MPNELKHKFVTGLTIILWVILILSIAWLIISISWWSMSVFIFKQLFVPYIVQSSIYGLFAVLSWILFIFIFLKIIERRISNSKINININNFSINNKTERMCIFEEKVDEEILVSERNLINTYHEKNIGDLNSTELLSYAVNLLSQENYIKSLSVLRIIVNKENTSTIIKYSAYNFMFRIFHDKILNKV